MKQPRSGCPINAAVEALGDHWSLLVLRDVIFGDRRYFRELQAGSIEGIASNILAVRLKKLVAAGILSREDSARGSRVRYRWSGTCSHAPAAMSCGWRTHWRTKHKIPANRLFRGGLESRYPSSADRGFKSLPPPLGRAASREAALPHARPLISVTPAFSPLKSTDVHTSALTSGATGAPLAHDVVSRYEPRQATQTNPGESTFGQTSVGAVPEEAATRRSYLR